MRILHTADWHLGHRLYGYDRHEEHAEMLNWLVKTITERQVQLLIVAGDVFDTMNPSNAARNLYYDFLGRLQRTPCRSVVIVGGNHDSPSLLDAPANILRHLQIHVVGGAKPDVREQVIPISLNGTQAPPDVIVAAVPYLRDRDLKYSVIGETAGEKVERLRASIREHYRQITEAAVSLRGDHPIPIVSTGHLFASGSVDAEDKATHIYLADRNNIEAGHFSPHFDYVALGHIHRSQRVGGQDHIRYSGSPLPLTFGEARIGQSVCIVDLENAGQTVSVERVGVPRARNLHSVHGPLEEVKQELKLLTRRQRSEEADPRCPWVDVRVESPHHIPLLREDLRAIVCPSPEEEDAGLEVLPRILRVTTRTPADERAQSQERQEEELEHLEPEDVFQRLCAGNGPPREDLPELMESFRELRGWMTENSEA